MQCSAYLKIYVYESLLIGVLDVMLESESYYSIQGEIDELFEYLFIFTLVVRKIIKCFQLSSGKQLDVTVKMHSVLSPT